MTDQCLNCRYSAWFSSAQGEYAMKRCKSLLYGLLSGWPRRSRSMLVFNAGSADFLETLWDCGFDVTAQESDPEHLEYARARLGKRAKFVLSSPDHLPFDDHSFDYAIAATAVEFWENPEAVLREIDRLACNGVIIIFPNAWSLFGLECRLRKKHPLCASTAPLLMSPPKLLRLTRKIFGKKKNSWISVLPGPTVSWRPLRLLKPLNNARMPLPLGAFVGLRIDFGPLYTGTPLTLPTTEPVQSGTALGRVSLSSGGQIEAPAPLRLCGQPDIFSLEVIS